ncbi:ABC transporter permease subunit [Edaphobacillus lindanitolerans]|uniref:Peptide/nickel transport system permease protein n=1 Tax=Edaphobacillus lindanitolerans TaxID=550447 RepID=A0A1U7PQS6_9BACI|nr:ABC transporter permease subunit [Edaphobacillus lindanitolerans]SIT91163.1 peptide/nickel transport system permease protein [Edaphobacillus lindanitolerans]
MNRILLTGIVMTGIVLLAVLFGPSLPLVDKSMDQNLVVRDSDGALLVPPIPPSDEFLIGTDRKGVDLWSRLMVGARETFYILGVILAVRLFAALLLSIGAFYSKGLRLLMDGWNAVFSFMPTIFIILILLAVPGVMFSDYRSFWVLIILAAVEVGRLALIFYENMEYQRRQTYMEAAVANGGGRWTLFRNYYWPSLVRELVITAPMEAGRTMFLLVQLGVIGIYVNQQFFSQLDRSYRAVEMSDAWPVLLGNLRQDIYSAPWIPIAALIAMTFSILGFYILAEGLKKRQAMKRRIQS